MYLFTLNPCFNLYNEDVYNFYISSKVTRLRRFGPTNGPEGSNVYKQTVENRGSCSNLYVY